MTKYSNSSDTQQQHENIKTSFIPFDALFIRNTF